MVGPHWPLLLTLNIPLCPNRPRSKNTDVQPNAPLLRIKSMYGALKKYLITCLFIFMNDCPSNGQFIVFTINTEKCKVDDSKYHVHIAF